MLMTLLLWQAGPDFGSQCVCECVCMWLLLNAGEIVDTIPVTLCVCVCVCTADDSSAVAKAGPDFLALRRCVCVCAEHGRNCRGNSRDCVYVCVCVCAYTHLADERIVGADQLSSSPGGSSVCRSQKSPFQGQPMLVPPS